MMPEGVGEGDAPGGQEGGGDELGQRICGRSVGAQGEHLGEVLLELAEEVVGAGAEGGAIGDNFPVGGDVSVQLRDGVGLLDEVVRQDAKGGDRRVATATGECASQELLHVIGAIEEEVFLAGEVVEHGRLRDVGRGGDIVDGDAVEAAFNEEPGGGVGDELARCALLALAQTLGFAAVIRCELTHRGPHIKLVLEFNIRC